MADKAALQRRSSKACVMIRIRQIGNFHDIYTECNVQQGGITISNTCFHAACNGYSEISNLVLRQNASCILKQV